MVGVALSAPFISAYCCSSTTSVGFAVSIATRDLVEAVQLKLQRGMPAEAMDYLEQVEQVFGKHRTSRSLIQSVCCGFFKLACEKG